MGDESKTETMKKVYQMVRDKGLNSGDDYISKIVNVPFDMFNDFLLERGKGKIGVLRVENQRR